MYTKTSFVTLVVATIVATSGLVSAQELVDTQLVLSATPPLGEGETWAGEPIQGSIGAMLCWDDPGGANPDQEAFTIEVSVSTVDWINITLSDESVEIEPPTDPLGEGCTDQQTINIDLEEDGLQPDATQTVTVSFSVADDGGVGTYSAPSDNSTSFTIQTVPGPEPPGNGDDENDLDENDLDEEDSDEPPEEEDTPGPAIMLFLVSAVTCLALWRRRRQ